MATDPYKEFADGYASQTHLLATALAIHQQLTYNVQSIIITDVMVLQYRDWHMQI